MAIVPQLPLDVIRPDPNISMESRIELVELDGETMVSFDATPEVEESGMVSYAEFSEGRVASSFLIYNGTPSRTFNISGKFISRTQAEAARTFKYKSQLQAWRMPLSAFGGDGLVGNDSGVGPRIIKLWGYGKLFLGIPTVLRSLSLSLPSDVDYINDGSGNMIPIVWPISISLQEAHTAEDIQIFDYNEYKAGTLEEWS